ncbi:hypothetical protein [Chryseobacterium scophthalmum]|uniref:Uncharacterized protein n=1 Tax=Chryseobacterium scophthalmum TaxID=59733 RepID=A0A1N6H8V1_9FLAO|nr:hypothetical protein [Chryseobacterium scophthalmum]SIO16186.1 hypothetical protein SAMN05421769_2308 [Chryseobacterium scophthalmum]
MIQLILMLLGLAFGNNNANTTNTDNNQDPITVQNSGGTTPGTGLGEDGGTSGNTGQKPPFTDPSTNP